ncbi:MAG: glycerol-3-phosphate 1-O-acyltransferase PlsY [Pseudomonadota bacterium]
MPQFSTPFDTLALVAIAAYLLGSVPFGMVMAKIFGLGNLRDVGSGNIGATNVLRTGSKPAALLTLILDAGKAAAAILVARALVGQDAAQVAGLAAFLGHLYPIYLRFKGGKGVATFLGALLALHPLTGALSCATWLVAAAITRISSLGALAAAAFAILWALIFNQFQLVLLITILAVLVFARHSENIARIKAGNEPKIGQGK